MGAAEDQIRHSLASALQAALAERLQTSPSTSAASETSDRQIPAKTLAFSPELVKAILDGRKTQTRRLIRPAPKTAAPSTVKCVIAQPNDLLAVREPWVKVDGKYLYAADDPIGVNRFKPAMYMPREASRLTIRVTQIDAQRLRQITDADALAEGCPRNHSDPVAWFAMLWDQIFTTPGERWADDPWVWVIRFERS